MSPRMSKKSAQTELVPRLRFPEFRDAGPWTAKPLAEYCDRITEEAGDAQLTPVSISSGTGFVSQKEKFGRDISGTQYSRYIRIRRGDFAYNRGNSKLFPQGCVYQLTEFDEAAASNAFYCFRLRGEYEPSFFEGLFESNCHGRQLMKDITSSARSDGLLNIRADTFFGIKIPMPPHKAEQRRIAKCLGSLDELIAAERRKLEALRGHKKGLMQQLFPREGETRPRLRFAEFRNAGDWQGKELGTMTSKVGSGITPRGGTANYKDVGRPFIRSQNVGWGCLILDDVVYIDEETHASFDGTEIEQGDVLLNISGASIGRCAVVDERIVGGNVNQHVCIIRTDPDVLVPIMLSQFLISDLGQRQIDQCQAGGNRQGLNFGQIRSFSIPIPPLVAEQQRIAGCLSALDALITVQAEKLEALRTHKRGLMQDLFPSPEEVGA